MLRRFYFKKIAPPSLSILWTLLLIVFAQFVSTPGGAEVRTPASFRPAWLDNYQVRAGNAPSPVPNASMLYDTRNRPIDRTGTPFYDFNNQISEVNQAVAREWRQPFEDMNRDYEMRERAGIVGPFQARAHTDQVAGFGNGMLNEIQKRKLSEAGDRAAHIAEKNEYIVKAATPAVVVAGIYIGRPMRVRIAENTLISLRTDFRGKAGSFEFHSPIVHGLFDFRPTVADTRDYYSPTTVNFGENMSFDHAVDFSQEKYQLSLNRGLPFLGMTSQILYGSSSNAVVGSLSKALTNNITCVFDSVKLLNSYDDARATTEEKIRLRYDFRF